MFDLDMTALRKTAKQPWLVANVANLANLANPIATEPKPPWLTLANVANSGDRTAQTKNQLARLASVSQRQFNAVAIEKPQISQISQISHGLLSVRLMAAAMRRCDHFNDSDKAREAMRQDVLATPAHLRQDLLDHFNETNQEAKP